jgi:hypothetical protein
MSVKNIIKDDQLSNLILFKDFCRHLVRITRVLKLSKSHLFLIG